MILHISLIAVGFLLVGKGGDLFVDSSVHIAKVLHIPRIVIGATIVSLATTVPELTVSAMASMMGDSGIALGNAVGSAIANIGLIAGVVGLIAVIKIDVIDFKRRSLWMTMSAILVVVFSWNLNLPRVWGLFLLFVSSAYLIVDYLKVRSEAKDRVQKPIPDDLTGESMGKSISYFCLGMALVVIGSRLLVTSGSSIASALGIPSVIIGLSIIAIGTSLPELVTGITAARKGVADLSIGNIVGANVLNLALITGISSVIHPLTLSRFTQVYSFSWLFIFIGAFYFMLQKDGTLQKWQSFLLLSLYFVYIAGLVLVPKF